MTSKMVVRQPQPMMYTQESDEWSSGICDCCQDVPGCKSLLIIFKVYRGLLLCSDRHTCDKGTYFAYSKGKYLFLIIKFLKQ